MPEVVDRGNPPQPSPEPGDEPEVPQQGGAEPKKRDAASRIAQLTKEKYEALRQVEGLQAQIQENDQRLARLEEMLTSRQGVSEPTRSGSSNPMSWSDVPQDDLERVIDSGPEENPQRFGMALREHQRRLAAQATQSAVAETEKKLRHEATIQETLRELNAQYPDFSKPDSEFRKLAEAEMAKIIRMEGKQAVYDPKNQRLAAASAYRALHAQDYERFQDQQRELERLKQVQALEAGKGAEKPSNQAKELLKKGDIRAALRALPQVRELREGR